MQCDYWYLISSHSKTCHHIKPMIGCHSFDTVAKLEDRSLQLVDQTSGMYQTKSPISKKKSIKQCDIPKLTFR